MKPDIRVQLFVRAVVNTEVVRDSELIVSAPQASIEHAKKTISEIHDTILNSVITYLPTNLYD